MVVYVRQEEGVKVFELPSDATVGTLRRAVGGGGLRLAGRTLRDDAQPLADSGITSEAVVEQVDTIPVRVGLTYSWNLQQTIETIIEVDEGQNSTDFAHALRAKVAEITGCEFHGRISILSPEETRERLLRWGVQMVDEQEFGSLLELDSFDEWYVGIRLRAGIDQWIKDTIVMID